MITLLFYVIVKILTPDKQQWKTLILLTNVDKDSVEADTWLQMAIKNTVSIDF